MKKIITLNGNSYEVPEDIESVQALLGHLDLAKRILIIEINEEILAKDEYDKPIQDRDKIEIIHFVGGG